MNAIPISTSNVAIMGTTATYRKKEPTLAINSAARTATRYRSMVFPLPALHVACQPELLAVLVLLHAIGMPGARDKEELTEMIRKSRWLFRCFFLACLMTTLAFGQAKEPPQDPLNRISPQSTVSSFLEACRAKNFERAMRYLDLRKLRSEQRLKEGPQLAQQLALVLDSDAQFDLAALSKDPEGDRKESLPANHERIATLPLKGKTANVELERQELRPGLSIWRFSPETVAEIPALAQAAAETPTEKKLPEPLVRWRFLDTSLWRWIALILSAAAAAGVSSLAGTLAVALIHRTAPSWDGGIAARLAGPVQVLLCAALFRVAMEAVDPSPKLRLYLGRAITLVTFLGIAWLCARIVDLVMRRVRYALDVKHHTFARSVLPLTARIVNITIFALAVVAVLGSWGYNTSAVLTGLGIGGIAIALAAQKTVENLFGGVAVITDRPVYVGETCKFGDSAGVVEDIGLRSTRIRTADRTLLTVPNAQLSSVAVENFSRRDKMLFHPVLNLRRDTTPDQVRTILESVERILRSNPKVEPGELPVRFVTVATNSLDIEVFTYIVTLDGNEFLKIQQELLLRILDAVAEAGTGLAMPALKAELEGV